MTDLEHTGPSWHEAAIDAAIDGAFIAELYARHAFALHYLRKDCDSPEDTHPIVARMLNCRIRPLTLHEARREYFATHAMLLAWQKGDTPKAAGMYLASFMQACEIQCQDPAAFERSGAALTKALFSDVIKETAYSLRRVDERTPPLEPGRRVADITRRGAFKKMRATGAAIGCGMLAGDVLQNGLGNADKDSSVEGALLGGLVGYGVNLDVQRHRETAISAHEFQGMVSLVNNALGNLNEQARVSQSQAR